MMKTLLMLACLASTIQINVATAASAIDVQGHRGARSVLPENTLAGFDYALAIGVDTLELDLGVSRDNVVVVIHDQFINADICQYKDGRAITEDLLVRSLDLKQIKEFDCGTKPNLRFMAQSPRPGSEIPTLAEVFELVAESKHPKAASVRFNIETKSNPALPNAQPAPTEFARLVIEQIDRFDLRSRAIIQSFDPRTLLAAHAQAADIPRAILLRNKPADWLAVASKYKSQIVSPYFEEINKDDVKRMRAAGIQVIPWTANAEPEWRSLIEMGVDGIITDDPLPLLKMLGRD